MKIEEFTQMLKDRPAPTSKQMENLEKIKKISKKFHRESGIDEDACDVELDEHTIVLESGHQPNFLPSLGIIKKAFLVDFLRKRLKLKEKNPVCIFGFSDYNICTAELMYQNKLPAANTNGYENIGFKLKSSDRLRRFNLIAKPAKEEWERTLEKTRELYSLYRSSGVENLDANLTDFTDIMNEGYGKAKNFADMNAFTIAHIFNNVLKFDLIMFRLSDVEKERILVDESTRLLSNFEKFKSISSTAVKHDGGIAKNYLSNSIPFWHQCRCGANIEIFLDENEIFGKCNLCGNEFRVNLDDFPKVFSELVPDAIGRNIIYFEGLGTSLFVSGTGGSLRYGAVSNAVSHILGFNAPPAVAWKGRDLYMGAAHLTALYSMMKLLKLKLEDFLEVEVLLAKINSALTESRGTKMENTLKNHLKSNFSMFQTIYSMLDIFVLLGVNREIANFWQLGEEELAKSDDIYILECDVIYNKPTKWVSLQDEQVRKIYDNIRNVQSVFLKDAGGDKNV